ncbi:hypothetical protein SUGI_0009000 [Cryptomeria japonica]|nr:hypothetical protein SUGI_0009000 [Cryptomeria japonica]
MKDPTNSFKGCERNVEIADLGSGAAQFVYLSHTDLYGNDLSGYAEGVSLEECRKRCMNDSQFSGFGYVSNGGKRYPKGKLINGYRSPGVPNDMYIRVSINDFSLLNSTIPSEVPTNSSSSVTLISDSRNYRRSKKSVIKYPLGFAIVIGVVEIVCITLGWLYNLRERNNGFDFDRQEYSAIPMGFKKFIFAQLKKATENFTIKLGEGGFITMNLARMFGFCAEGHHRLPVYEIVENGSLDKYLFTESEALGWKEKFAIVVGTAKGLAYLHEECLEWILHCDVKPQNILLDEKFCPKVSDF